MMHSESIGVEAEGTHRMSGTVSYARCGDSESRAPLADSLSTVNTGSVHKEKRTQIASVSVAASSGLRSAILLLSCCT